MNTAMKNKIYRSILALSAAVVLATGCNGFLDETDQSKFVANTADHFSSLLLGEFNYSYSPYAYVPFMTDEISDGVSVSQNNSGREYFRPFFCWQRDVEKNMTDYTQIDQSSYWAYCYKMIVICNNIFENIDKASESVPGEISYVKAEACFVKALMYFNLVNLYAEPYRAATAATTMGIPLKEDTGIETSYDRNRLDECYNKIVSLLNDGIAYITESGLTYDKTFKINEDAIRILLSRVYLFMGEWDKVISTLEPVMSHAKCQTMPDNGGKCVGPNSTDPKNLTWDTGNFEVVYAYGLGTESKIQANCSNYYFNASSDLYALYDETDLRRDLWFNAVFNKDTRATTVIPYKCSSSYYTKLGQVIMRYAEAYLNIVEAYARKNDVNTATTYLKKFLPSRHRTIDGIVLPSSQNELVSYIMDERLREYCYEEFFRWFDLRRMEESERPEITHEFAVMQNTTLVRTEVYHLMKNDPNYTLSLPYKEKDNNPMIMDYDRFDKVPY